MFNGLFNWNYILGVEDELKFSSEVSVIFADERLHVYKTWAMVVEAQDSGREDQRDLHTNPDHPQPRAEVTPPEKLRPPGWGRWDKLLYEYKKITRILKAVQAPPAYKGRGASGPSRGGAAIFGTAPGARLNTIKVREAHSGPLGGHLYLLSISVLEIISLLKFSGLIGATTFNYFKNSASEMKTSYPDLLPSEIWPCDPPYSPTV